MKKQIGLGLGALALAAALTACGGAAGTSSGSSEPVSSAPTSALPTSVAPSSAAAELKAATSSTGQIVVDGKGMSVYFFTKDIKDSGKSACVDACAAAWPAVITSSGTPLVEGVTGTIGTITSADGKKQVTVNGLPVYHFANDKAPGDILGQGVKGVWYLVSPAGEMVKTAATGS